ncbi:MAG: helix-turn-helix domain-containing protein [Halobacteriota archaeon]|uniref:winged helix-turn-helix domain-containing protein n=1 Tax=Halanaeroarchaeum sp. HSR-CO TaxID=2866382 RepID=UPI00217DB177|nr:helix-turn-helix domain-containing protein [Halanaeroarchaeum sp. HSR-CO]UWG46305.1 Transcriptional regulator containing HTH domain,ArsR family [Halanaeroarchaeum sp. HSR-CO]
MVAGPLSGGGDLPDVQSVLDALDDKDCRRIVEVLTEPMTAKEISEGCDMPLSTTYRKLDLLTEASLLSERTVIQSDGHHTTQYEIAFERVEIELDDDHNVTVAIQRRPESTDERLETLWAEVRKET